MLTKHFSSFTALYFVTGVLIFKRLDKNPALSMHVDPGSSKRERMLTKQDCITASRVVQGGKTQI